MKKLVDTGDYLQRGMPVAFIASTDYAEIRFAIPDAELAFLDFPFDTIRPEPNSKDGYDISLSATFAGKPGQWDGWLQRSESQIDPQTRMIYLIARVADPYGDSQDQPLASGLFVDIKVKGKTVENVIVIPRSALRLNSQVHILDNESKLRFTNVEVLRLSQDHAVIGSGIKAGDKIIVNRLDAVVEGMHLRLAGEKKQ